MEEEAKALRESAERAAKKERKQQERDAATDQKSRDRPNKASKHPHKVPSERLNEAVVQWVVRLHPRRHLHPLGRHDPTASPHTNINLSSTNCTEASIY
jgi:hypothetical protein